MSRRLIWVGGFAFGAIGVVVALWTIPDLEEKTLTVRLDDVEPVRRGGRPNAVRFAVAPMLSPSGTAFNFEPLTRHLRRFVGPVRLVQRKNYQDVNDLLRARTVQVALICPGAYLQALREGVSLDVLVVPYYRRGPTYHSYIIVRADSDIESFAQLRERPFAFADPLSLSGHFYPMEWALQSGFDPQEFFRNATFTYSHADSIEAVLDDTVDGAAVDSLVWHAEVSMRPDLRARVRILHESPPLGASPVVVPARLDPALRARLRDGFVRAGETADGRLALQRMGIDRFGDPPPGLYDRERARFSALMTRLEGER